MPMRISLPTAKIVAAYVSGQTTRKIAAFYNVDRTTIEKRLQESGVKFRGSVKILPDEVIKKYQSGDSAASLCRRFDVAPQTLRKFLVESGIPIRSIAETNQNKPARRTHGYSKRSVYCVYRAMLNRCYNENVERFPSYGGAKPPVRVCTRWRGEHGFTNFLADMGERFTGMSIGRFLDIGNYEPGNCEWQTNAQQAAERKGKTAMLAYRKAKSFLLASSTTKEAKKMLMRSSEYEKRKKKVA